MRADPVDHLFRLGVIVQLPDPAVEDAAEILQSRGLLSIEERRVVRCVNMRDPDIHESNRSCVGEYPVLVDADEDFFHSCPDCDRALRPLEKQSFQQWMLAPVAGQMVAWVQECLAQSTRPTTQVLAGLWRVTFPNGEVEVCLVDVCPDLTVLRPDPARVRRVVYVLGNVEDFRRHLPADAVVVRLVDTVRDRGVELRRRLRELSGAAARPAIQAVSALPPLQVVATSTLGGEVRPGFSTPPGTRWADVKIYLVDGLTVQIRVPGVRPRSFTAGELGMTSKKRDRKKTMQWDLLVALCEGRGSQGVVGSFTAFKVRVSKLRGQLRDFMGIDDDPFVECSRKNGLRSRFIAGPLPEDAIYVGDDRW